MELTIKIEDAPLNSVVKDEFGSFYSICEKQFGIDADGFGWTFDNPRETVKVVAVDVLNWEEIRKQYK